MTEALKFDNNKPGMDLLPVEAKKAIAEVFDFGAKKYARHNWRAGFDYSRLIAACERHLDAFNDGEDNDPESGKSHLAHAGCCLMMLLESVIKGYGTDNRHNKEKFHKPNELITAIGEPTKCTLTGAWRDTNTAVSVKEAADQMSGMNDAAKKVERSAEAWLTRTLKRNGN
jgi:hypothetical protein